MASLGPGSDQGSSWTGLGSEPASEASARLAAISRGQGDAERRQAGAFQAPEGVWLRDADRVRLDVFALGALAFYLFAGTAPATDRSALRERLRRENGLDLAAELPLPSQVRDVVLHATRPAVAERLADVRAFLRQLEDAEQALIGSADVASVDPLEARADTVLDGRFRVLRRLGAGSTAVGLKVVDLTDKTTRVLKVALDDTAAARLMDEAEVLRGLDHPRLVTLIDGPLTVGGRSVLVLKDAGEQSLGDVLAERRRLSIDLLERWGTDLLEAAVELDRLGVMHRDIKPSNLGMVEQRRDRAKHLVLFDFSLARAGAGSVTAGTPPYLDPFLDSPGRRRYDSAAERYAVAVVLFQMATGTPPVYGDGLSDPSVLGVEATVADEMFDPVIGGSLASFFRQALHPDTVDRFDTVADMLAAWRAVFVPVARPAGTTGTPEPALPPARVQPATPLAESGLSARALSALEPLRVATVAELLVVDRVRLNRLRGVAQTTRRELIAHAEQWREQLGAATPTELPTWSGPLAAAQVLRDTAGSARAVARRRAAEVLLGLTPGLDSAFATQAELAEALDVTPARGNQLVDQLQVAWSERTESRELLDSLGSLALDALAALGGVATVDELAAEVLTALGAGEPVDGVEPERLAAGLLRVALDRAEQLRRAEPDSDSDDTLARRRRGGRLRLIATRSELLDLADRLADRATELLASRGPDESFVPAAAVQRDLTELAGTEAGLTADRLVSLVAAHAPDLAVSGRGELYATDLPLARAVGLALGEIPQTQQWKPHEVRDRVRVRFPALPPLPTDRYRLDALLAEAGLPVHFDDTSGAYRADTRPGDTTGLESRAQTFAGPIPRNPVVEGGHAASRLAESERTRSFLALGVPAKEAPRALERLRRWHGVRVVDLTRVLIEEMRRQAAIAGLPWELVRAADAAEVGSRDAAGLAALVARALPAVAESIDAATGDSGPVLITELSPLARYGHLSMLARWTDLALRRDRPVWALLPQLPGNTGAVVDGKPLPLGTPGQFLRLDGEWMAVTADRNEVPA